MTHVIECADGAERDRAVAAAVAAARRGDLVVVPTETVYAVVTDAFSTRGVARLREAKAYRENAPIPVFVGGRATVGGVAARMSQAARDLMEAFWPGPLTLLLEPQPTLAWDLPVATPLAVRMPAHPLLLAVLARTGPLAGTTANAPGLPAPTTAPDALDQLGDAVAMVLDAGPLVDEADEERPLSTIVDCTVDPPRIVRDGAITSDRIEAFAPSGGTADSRPTA